MLDEYDSDKDGFISLSEFIGDVRGDGKTTRINVKSSTDLFVAILLYCAPLSH